VTWTTEDSLAMVRHYLGYEIGLFRSGHYFVRKGEDCSWVLVPWFPDDREETFRCLEAWMRYHPGDSIGISWTHDIVVVGTGDGIGIFTPTLHESLLRMLLEEALAAQADHGSTKEEA